MSNYFNITVEGKWVECKKALPRATFPHSMNLMKDAVLMKFDDGNDSILNENHKERERLPLGNRNMNVSRNYSNVSESAGNFPPVFGEFREIEIDDDKDYKTIDLDGYSRNENNENKENRHSGQFFINLAQKGYKEDIIDSESEKLKPKDPRKNKLLELKNKSSNQIVI